jgi:hypothetical protein
MWPALFLGLIVLVIAIQCYLMHRVKVIASRSKYHPALFFWRALNTPWLAPPGWEGDLDREPEVKLEFLSLRKIWRRLTLCSAVLIGGAIASIVLFARN